MTPNGFMPISPSQDAMPCDLVATNSDRGLNLGKPSSCMPVPEDPNSLSSFEGSRETCISFGSITSSPLPSSGQRETATMSTLVVERCAPDPTTQIVGIKMPQKNIFSIKGTSVFKPSTSPRRSLVQRTHSPNTVVSNYKALGFVFPASWVAGMASSFSSLENLRRFKKLTFRDL